MSSQDAGFLALRLMALWYAVDGLVQLPISIAATIAFRRSADGRSTSLPVVEMLLGSYPLVTTGAYLLVAAVLFYGAKSFSRALVCEPGAESGPTSARTLLGVGLLLIGTFQILGYFPALAKTILDRQLGTLDSKGSDATTIVANAVGFGLAVLLIAASFWQARRSGLGRSQHGDEADREVGG